LYVHYIAPQVRADWKTVDTLSPKIKEQDLQAYSNEILQKLEEKVKKGITHKENMGFWERLMMKIIDNVQINVK